MAKTAHGAQDPGDEQERTSSGWNRAQREGEPQRGQGSDSVRQDSPGQAEINASRYEAPEGTRWQGDELDANSDQVPQARSMGEFETYEPEFHRHFDVTYSKQGYDYQQYLPAYRFGYDLRTNPQYRGRDFTDVENHARDAWEAVYPGTWNRYRDAIQYGWRRSMMPPGENT